MRTSVIALFGLVAGTFAVPAMLRDRQATLCPGTDSTPLCCDVNILGVADLDCETPPSTPTDVADFQSICAANGKTDMCCLLPILGQGLICSVPAGA